MFAKDFFFIKHTHTHTHTHITTHTESKLPVLQHEQMLVVRKEGKAHAQYNSFRSAFELLEAVGREPHDSFEETHEDLSPLEKMEQQIETLLSGMHELKDEVHELKVENELLRSRLENLEQQTTITTVAV